jgi:predicted alpha/beta-hydrolase family hydrolase
VATTIEIPTPHGPARAHLRPVAGARGLLALGHGAGGGVEARDLLTVAAVAQELAISVALVEQPYRVAGRRSAASARQLDEAWSAVIEHLLASALVGAPLGAAARRGEAASDGGAASGGGAAGGSAARGPFPLIVGGRSSGARVACRTAAATGATGVLCLAFPLQPPIRSGKTEPPPSRLPELDGVTVPTLVIQGVRDRFGMPPEAPNRTVVTVAGDHALRAEQPMIGAAARAWMAELLGATA